MKRERADELRIWLLERELGIVEPTLEDWRWAEERLRESIADVKVRLDEVKEYLAR